MSGPLQTNESLSSKESKRRGVCECEHEMGHIGSESNAVDGFSFQSDARFEYDEQNGSRAFAKFVCSTQVPPKMVEDNDFRELARKFNPSFNISVKMVESECLIVYEEMKLKIKEVLGNFEGQISLSLEILKYYNYRDYLCLSAHFIDENWKMRKLVLHFCSVSDPEDSLSDDFLCRDWGILKLLEKWGIKDKISTFIMTNDYGSVADYLKSHIQGNKETGLNGSLFHGFPVRCCGEMVSLMVQEAFDKIKDIIEKVRALSSSAKSLPLWNHTIFDLQQGLKLWTMGEYSRKEITNFHDVPSPEEWKKVEGVCKIVGSIYEVSNALFETKHLTANVYLYHLHELRELLYQMTMQSDGFIRTIAEAMLKKLGKYWDEMFLLLAITAALDPRFKMKYIEFVCSKVNGDASTQVLAVWRAIQKQFDEYQTRFPEEETFLSDSSSSDSDSDSEEEPPIPLHVNHIFSVLQDYHQCIQLSNQPTKKSDLDYYLEEPILPWSQKFSALTWWKTAGAKYPILSRMAHDFLAIPVSLATSYDAFYTEPRPVDGHMIRLKPNLANALMCTRSWCSSLKEY